MFAGGLDPTHHVGLRTFLPRPNPTPGEFHPGRDGMRAQFCGGPLTLIPLKISHRAHRVGITRCVVGRRELVDRNNWWGESDDDTLDENTDHDRVDPNDPAEIIAHKILRETATVVCATTLLDSPKPPTRTAELFAFLDGETWDKYALHTENESIELTDPTIRLGQHAPDSTLVGEYGCERHRKRYNPETGYITGGETTGVLIQDRPRDELLSVIENWLRGVAARGDNGIREGDVDEGLVYAERLKENAHHNGFRDVDIMAKVVSKVR